VPAGKTLAVDGEAGLELVRRVDQRRGEDRHPVSRRERESVGTIGGDPHRRVGPLHRPRHHSQLSRLKVFSFKGKGVVCPRRKNEVERLIEARAALLGRDAITRVVSRDTATDAEFKATVAENIGDRRLLGDLYRAVQWQQGYRRAEANATGPLGAVTEEIDWFVSTRHG
jgi:hypothetical protein